jgi:hypothetical protein
MIAIDLWNIILDYLDYNSCINVGNTCSTLNLMSKKKLNKNANVLIYKYRKNKFNVKKRKEIFKKHNYKLFRFKPFIICRIFDNSTIYKNSTNNIVFIENISKHLKGLDKKLSLTEAQKNTIKNISEMNNTEFFKIKNILKIFSIKQLLYII